MEAKKNWKKPVGIASMAIHLLLSALIIVESCIQGEASGAQSNFFARIGAAIVNFFSGPVEPSVIEPLSFAEYSDSTHLGKGEDGLPRIAIGTTSLISFEGIYPKKTSRDAYDRDYHVDRTNEEELNASYAVAVSTRSSGVKYYVDVRITTDMAVDEICSIKVSLGNLDPLTYAFRIVDLPAPASFSLLEESYSLKQGQTAMINVKLEGERGDAYERRYYDVYKIPSSSDDNEIAYIDDRGVIHAVHEGSTTLHYGDKDIPVNVSDESIVVPSSNALSVTFKDESKSPSLLDYDYVFEKSAYSDLYGSLIYPHFEDDSLEDQNIAWTCSDPFAVKLAPHHYDENGFPIYKDDEGKQCIRAVGYRRQKDVTITGVSTADPSLSVTVPLSVGESKAATLEITNLTRLAELTVADQTNISTSFTPKNTTNKAIHVVTSDASGLAVLNNDSASVSLKAVKSGTYHVEVTSLSDPSLKVSFNTTVKDLEVIDQDNYSAFHQNVRKFIGHFSLFLATAVFGVIGLFLLLDNRFKMLISSGANLTVGLSLAVVSEVIQYYMPGRAGLVSDVFIDFGGFVMGVALVIGVIFLIRFIIKRRKEKALKKADIQE